MKRLAETSKPLTTLNYAPFLMFDRALNMSKFEIEEESYFTEQIKPFSCH